MASMEKTRSPMGREQDEVREPPAPAPDALRALVATLVQDTIRAEFDRFVGAAPYERTPPPAGRTGMGSIAGSSAPGLGASCSTFRGIAPGYFARLCSPSTNAASRPSCWR